MVCRLVARRVPPLPRLARSISLVSDRYAPPPSPTAKGPVLVLHGLYGSRQNWRSLAKTMARALHREIVTLDLRNHGESPHSPEATYDDLAADVVEFVQKHGWKEDITLIGHSMGGKVAMAAALSGAFQLERLIVVDISPERGRISGEFASYLTAMREITHSKIKSRKEADAILQRWEPELSVRQFLLTNLVRNDATGFYSFRIPLDFLSDALDRGEIGGFPYLPLDPGDDGADGGYGVRMGPDEGAGEKRRWDGRALFLKGSRSKYINNRNIPTIKAFFPNSTITTLDAGHWVHAEQPKAFVENVAAFCRT